MCAAQRTVNWSEDEIEDEDTNNTDSQDQDPFKFSAAAGDIIISSYLLSFAIWLANTKAIHVLCLACKTELASPRQARRVELVRDQIPTRRGGRARAAITPKALVSSPKRNIQRGGGRTYNRWSEEETQHLRDGDLVFCTRYMPLSDHFSKCTNRCCEVWNKMESHPPRRCVRFQWTYGC